MIYLVTVLIAFLVARKLPSRNIKDKIFNMTIFMSIYAMVIVFVIPLFFFSYCNFFGEVQKKNEPVMYADFYLDQIKINNIKVSKVLYNQKKNKLSYKIKKMPLWVGTCFYGIPHKTQLIQDATLYLTQDKITFNLNIK